MLRTLNCLFYKNGRNEPWAKIFWIKSKSICWFSTISQNNLITVPLRRFRETLLISQIWKRSNVIDFTCPWSTITGSFFYFLLHQVLLEPSIPCCTFFCPFGISFWFKIHLNTLSHLWCQLYRLIIGLCK